MACALCGFKLDLLGSVNFKYNSKIKGRSHSSCVARFSLAKKNDEIIFKKLGEN